MYKDIRVNLIKNLFINLSVMDVITNINNEEIFLDEASESVETKL